MNSMTGYGRGEASNGDVAISIEIRSVNNRFRDLQIKVPKFYLSLEPRIKKIISKKINRGRIEIFIRRDTIDSGQKVTYDAQLAESYYKAMTNIAKRLQRDSTEISLSDIFSQPGVLLSVETEPDALQEWTIVVTALESALDDLLRMRLKEGETLKADLENNLKMLLRYRNDIYDEIDNINHKLLQRFNKRLQRLLADRIDPIRLAQEAAILVDKADISEELVRLQSHCEQLGSLIQEPSPIGRKLDFLLQELNREINTIGSKANDQKIAKLIVNMKSTLEKLREQVSNIE
jgi:uncharacterized protein (TIGR00255 family)